MDRHYVTKSVTIGEAMYVRYDDILDITIINAPRDLTKVTRKRR